MKSIACAALLFGAIAAQAQNRDIWGLQPNDAIERFTGKWENVTGLLANVSVANDGTVVGVTRSQTIFRWNGSGWDQLPGLLTEIAAGTRGHIWGVSAGNEIWRWNDGGNTWEKIPGRANRITVSSDGAVWVLSPEGVMYRWTGAGWNEVPGLAFDIAAGSVSNVWHIGTGNDVYRYNPAKVGLPWDRVPGQLKKIAVTADGEVWGLDMTDRLVRRVGEAWEPQGKAFVDFSAGAMLTPSSNSGAVISGRIEEDDPGIRYDGAWNRQADPSASGGGFMVSSIAASTLTIRFSGDTIAFYRRLDTDGGDFNLRVDNKDCGNMSSYFSERRWNVPAVLNGLGVGEHTLVLTVLGNRPSGSAGSNVYIDSIAAPAPFPPNSIQQSAINRFNAVRNAAGLPPARLSPAINLAAQGHADYLRQNPSSGGHDQTPGTPGFIGVGPSERMRYFGYDRGGAENSWPASDGPSMINNVLDSVYHRVPLFRYSYTEAGFGLANGQSVMNFGVKQAPPAPASRILSVYPSDGQTNVVVRWDSGEQPRPLPDKARPFGALISLHITQPAGVTRGSSTAPLSGTLLADGGASVPVYLLSSANDRNLGADDFFMIPQAPLAYGTTFTARMEGADSMGNPFSREWRFSTVPASTITGFSGEVSGGGYRVLWFPAGDVASTSLAWGPTNALGTTIQGTAIAVVGSPSFYSATIGNLNAGTYFYQITATDLKGSVFRTPLTQFVMPEVPVGFTRMFEYNFTSGAISLSFAVTKPVASVEVQWGTSTEFGNTGNARPDDNPGEYFFTLFNLAPNTYHYRLIAKDANGQVVATSENRTFRIP